VNQRRQFLAWAGALFVLPIPCFAQRTSYARRIGVLSGGSSADLELQASITALVQGLRDLGWRNLHIHARYAERDPGRLRQAARELLAYQPEVVVAATSNEVAVLRDQAPSIPIIFTQVPDPVDAGFVSSFGRPGDYATGIASFDASVCDGSLRALKACAPSINRVAVVFDPVDPSWPAYVRSINAAAPAIGMSWSPAGVQNPAELARELEGFARTPNCALLVLPSLVARNHRDLMIELAARHRLPAIYPRADFAANGGLMSYGVNVPHQYRQAAAYVDRILRGARAADLPAGSPAKLDLAINLETANSLRLTIPRSLLERADLLIG
jgi:putative tryptophan/tyrosine transport system substrate-binding protein